MPMQKLNAQLRGLFLEEVRERTQEMERTLLLLEKAGDKTVRREALARLLKIAHSLKGAAGLMEIRPIEAACHRMEDLIANAREEEAAPDRSLLNLLLAVTDAIAETGRMIEQGRNPEEGPLGEALERLEVASASGGQSSGRDEDEPARPKARRSLKEASEPAAASMPATSPFASEAMDDRIRVPAERLDSLLYRSNELLLSRSRSHMRNEQVSSLREVVGRLREPRSGSRGRLGRTVAAATGPAPIAQELTALESGLRDLARNLAEDGRMLDSAAASLNAEISLARMQPFAQVCQGLERMVRDISRAQGKSVELTIEGGAVELDRSILAALRDPLRHLVRNAVDHGVESPAARRAAGKPERGRITVSASLVGDRVQVRVQDDGGGVDLHSLRKQTEAAGGDSSRSEEELLRQVFLPGISTSPEVTRLSGRGVGLDIVRTAMERLRGAVELSQIPGGGATFRLTLPLTVAAFRALLVSAGEQVFALDASCVRRLVRVAADDIRLTNGRRTVASDGLSMPVLDFSRWLGVTPRRENGPFPATAMVLGSDAGEIAVLIDEASGEQELVARSLGPRLAKLRGYAGGAVLADGSVALILNAAALVEAAAEGRDGLDVQHEDEQPAAKIRLLVVDDSRAIRALGKFILEGAGYEVAIASNGSEAWERLRRQGAHAVIADVDMPLMDGFDLTQKIRDSEEFRNLPVILVTARETAEDKARGLFLGADAYLTKSAFDQGSLLETIRQLI